MLSFPRPNPSVIFRARRGAGIEPSGSYPETVLGRQDLDASRRLPNRIERVCGARFFRMRGTLNSSARRCRRMRACRCANPADAHAGGAGGGGNSRSWRRLGWARGGRAALTAPYNGGAWGAWDGATGLPGGAEGRPGPRAEAPSGAKSCARVPAQCPNPSMIWNTPPLTHLLPSTRRRLQAFAVLRVCGGLHSRGGASLAALGFEVRDR
jgi:hypothetical protein